MRALPFIACLVLCSLARAQSAIDCPNPVANWAITSDNDSRWLDFAVGLDGAIYVAGNFALTRDADPTDGEDIRTAHGFGTDVFVTKLNADRSYAWTIVVGGEGTDNGRRLAIAKDGGVVLVGDFQQTVDFDPSDGVDIHDAGINDDTKWFVMKLNADGSYAWTKSTGGMPRAASANDVSIDADGSIFFTGCFGGRVDFDPSFGADKHTATGSQDIFVTKLESDGTYGWTRTFGGRGFDCGRGVAVHPLGGVRVIGTFRGLADFDPSDGVDEHLSIGEFQDIFVTALNAHGSYGWTHTWPAAYSFSESRVVIDEYGDTILTGSFRGSVDFDPGEPVDLHESSVDRSACFVTRLGTVGTYLWTRSMPASRGCGSIGSIAVRGLGVVVTGTFGGVTDFAPRDGGDVRESGSTFNDLFVTAFDDDGTYLWTRTMGRSPNVTGEGKDIELDRNGELLLFGSFTRTNDLNPGCGVLEETPLFEAASTGFITNLVCPEPMADVNGDGALDLRDFAAMQRCFSGPAPTVCGDDCESLDLDADDDIDLDDYLMFDALTNP